jgi:hypothetical protein
VKKHIRFGISGIVGVVSTLLLKSWVVLPLTKVIVLISAKYLTGLDLDARFIAYMVVATLIGLYVNNFMEKKGWLNHG